MNELRHQKTKNKQNKQKKKNKQTKTKNKKEKEHKMASPVNNHNADTTLLHSHDN